MKMKKAWCIALAAAMTFMSVMPAFAADIKIDTVKLTFSYDTAPASGVPKTEANPALIPISTMTL